MNNTAISTEELEEIVVYYLDGDLGIDDVVERLGHKVRQGQRTALRAKLEAALSGGWTPNTLRDQIRQLM